jgi:hypothetical protein
MLNVDRAGSEKGREAVEGGGESDDAEEGGGHEGRHEGVAG